MTIDLAARLKSYLHAFSKSAKELLGLDRPHSYRPEVHYMRGPGPKWRAIHGDPRRAPAGTTRRGGSRTL